MEAGERHEALFEQATMANPGISESSAHEMVRADLESHSTMRLPDRLALIETVREQTAKHFRICALATNPTSVLMWSHYADKHRGFCLGIDMEQLEARKDFGQGGKFAGFPIDYVKEIPKLIPGHMSEKEIVWTNITTKSEDWVYEGEYRLYGDADLEFVNLRPTDIAQVILGWDISAENASRVRLALEEFGCDAPVYHAFKDWNTFSMKCYRVDLREFESE